MDLNIAERIHTVIQGEGKNLGKKMIALRTFGCSIKCPSCDSKQTWDPAFITSERRTISAYLLAKDIKRIADETNVYHLMITGGEPAQQAKELRSLMIELGDEFTYDIETAGVFKVEALEEFYDKIYFDFSPKVGRLQAGINIKKYLAFKELPPNYSIKVVTTKKTLSEDKKQILQLQEEYGIPNDNIFLMPFGTHREAILDEAKYVIDACFENKWNFAPRMHILIYDSEKLR